MPPSSKKGSSKSPKSHKKGQKGKAARETESVEVNNEDYNIRSPERTELLTQIKEVIGNTPVTPAFWACCQLADMNCLRDIAKSPRNMIVLLEKPVSALAMQWNQGLRDSEFPGPTAASRRSDGLKRRKLNSDAQSSVPRSRKVADDCKKRDDDRCVLTRRPHPQAARIFPYCIFSPRPPVSRYHPSNAIPEFGESLALFWDEDRINKWCKASFTDPENPDIGAERCFNLISLSPDAHDMWNNGMLALKPLKLSRNRKKLIVQVFLQAPGNYKIDSRIDLLTEPTSSEGLEVVGDGYVLHRVENDGSSLRIRSGETFTLTTKDPEKLPLPNLELLEMQWFLQRLVGMCGAAEWPSLDDDDGDDDSVDNDDGWLIPDYSNGNSLKRVREWVGAEEATGITPETLTATASPSMIQCH